MSPWWKWVPTISVRYAILPKSRGLISVFLTNIGEAHIEHLGSKEGILKAKSEMLEYIKTDGRVFVNGDDPYLRTLKEARTDVTAFGKDPQNDIYAEKIKSKGLDGTDFVIHTPDTEFPAHVPSPGGHMVYNALAAAAAGLALGMGPDEIALGLAAYKTIAGRMCIETRNRITVLNDVYNANPGSMRAALDVLAYAEGGRVCVLGDMLELGEKAEQYHRELGAYAARRADRVLCVGTLAKHIYTGAKRGGCGSVLFRNAGRTACKKYGGWYAKATPCWSKPRAECGSKRRLSFY